MPDLKLTAYDRNVLLHPVGWITDSIVDAAQTLLKQQFPHIQSLQNVTKGMTMSFYIQTGAFVQILHSDGHWFTVSSSGGSIKFLTACIALFQPWVKLKLHAFCTLKRKQFKWKSWMFSSKYVESKLATYYKKCLSLSVGG